MAACCSTHNCSDVKPARLLKLLSFWSLNISTVITGQDIIKHQTFHTWAFSFWNQILWYAFKAHTFQTNFDFQGISLMPDEHHSIKLTRKWRNITKAWCSSRAHPEPFPDTAVTKNGLCLNGHQHLIKRQTMPCSVFQKATEWWKGYTAFAVALLILTRSHKTTPLICFSVINLKDDLWQWRLTVMSTRAADV